jgi:formate dehydrogenase assembly factor FdhD
MRPAAFHRSQSAHTQCPCAAAAALLQLADKSELIRKDVAAHEASSKLSGATRQLEDAIREWVDEGAAMAQG